MYIVYIHITAVERRVVVSQRAQSIMEKICKPLKKKKGGGGGKDKSIQFSSHFNRPSVGNKIFTVRDQDK